MSVTGCRFAIVASAWMAMGCGGGPTTTSSGKSLPAGSDASAPPGTNEPPCTPLSELQSDTSGALLDRAAQEHSPTEEEIQASARVWAIAIAGASGAPIDPAFANANPRTTTAFVPNAYPTAFASCGASPVGSSVQRLVASSDDFSCGNSCDPSPVLFQGTLDTIMTRMIPNRGASLAHDGGRGWGLSSLCAAGDGQLVRQATDLLSHASEQEAGADASTSMEARAFLENVGTAVTTLAGMSGDGTTTTAATVGVISAYQAGWDVGAAANLIAECNTWKSDHACGTSCCENGRRCVDPSRGLCCAAGQTACGTACCAQGLTCQDVTSGTCGCDGGRAACGTTCCPPTQKCLDQTSSKCGCASAEVACGTACCGALEVCPSAAASVCRPCIEGETACGSVCCPANQWCGDRGRSSCVDLCEGRYAVLSPGVQQGGRVTTQGTVQDTLTGLSWDRYEVYAGEGTREEARVYCQSRGMRLPTMEEALTVDDTDCAWPVRWHTWTSNCSDVAYADPAGNRTTSATLGATLCVRD